MISINEFGETSHLGRLQASIFLLHHPNANVDNRTVVSVCPRSLFNELPCGGTTISKRSGNCKVQRLLLLEVVEDDLDSAAVLAEVLSDRRKEEKTCQDDRQANNNRSGVVQSSKLNQKQNQCDVQLGLTVTATAEAGTTLRALPSLSILQRPAHSPSCLLSSTWSNEIGRHDDEWKDMVAQHVIASRSVVRKRGQQNEV